MIGDFLFDIYFIKYRIIIKWEAGSEIVRLKILCEENNLNYRMGIDLGGGYIKMSIVDISNSKVIYTKSVNYMLTKCLLENNHIIPQFKINEIVNIIKDFLSYGDKYNVSKINAAATGGLRICKNSNELIQKVYNATNIKIELIDGTKEAELSRIGALMYFKNNPYYFNKFFVLIDLGSTSTEISVTTLDKTLQSVSKNIGATIFTQKFKTFNRIIEDNEFDEMYKFLDLYFKNINISIPYNSMFILTGASGFNILEVDNPSLTDNLIKSKGIMPITINNINNVLEIVKNNRNTREEDKERVFAHTFILKYLFNLLNIKTLYYSTTTLKESLTFI